MYGGVDNFRKSIYWNKFDILQHKRVGVTYQMHKKYAREIQQVIVSPAKPIMKVVLIL